MHGLSHARTIATLTTAAVLILSSGCASVRARFHPCHEYVAHRFGTVPPSVAARMASESGAKRSVGGKRAPIGFYWRPAGTQALDLDEVRTLLRGHELVACPGIAASAIGSPAPKRSDP